MIAFRDEKTKKSLVWSASLGSWLTMLFAPCEVLVEELGDANSASSRPPRRLYRALCHEFLIPLKSVALGVSVF